MAKLPKNGDLDTFLVVFLTKVDFSCMLYIIYIAKRSQTYTTLNVYGKIDVLSKSWLIWEASGFISKWLDLMSAFAENVDP